MFWLRDFPAVERAVAADPIHAVDVGVAGGLDPLFATANWRAHTRYTGFEPNPASFAALPAMAGARYLQLALSNAAGKQTFYLRKGKSSFQHFEAGARVREATDSIDVNVETLENLRARGEVPRIDVLKTDSEGHDTRIVAGCGKYLRDEVLVVKAEVQMADRGENSLSECQQLLADNGFALFGLQMRNGAYGEVAGADALWIRSVFGLVDRAPASLHAMLLRLIGIALLLRLPEYAYVCVQEGAQAGVLTAPDAAALSHAIECRPFVPSLYVPSKTSRVPHLLALLATLASGARWGAKSFPRSNTLVRYDRLFVQGGWLGRKLQSRTRARLQRVHTESARAARPGPA